MTPADDTAVGRDPVGSGPGAPEGSKVLQSSSLGPAEGAIVSCSIGGPPDHDGSFRRHSVGRPAISPEGLEDLNGRLFATSLR
jgi:hypothetical protein